MSSYERKRCKSRVNFSLWKFFYIVLYFYNEYEFVGKIILKFFKLIFDKQSLQAFFHKNQHKLLEKRSENVLLLSIFHV